MMTRIFLIFFLISPFLYSQTETVYASYKYIMGDNDTKSDAKRICFLEAKRLCIEKAGTYIESNVVVENYKLTRDEIRSYAAAILKVEIISEEIKFVEESVNIFLTVKADINKNLIKERIKEIKSDRQLQKKILTQQNQLIELEKKIYQLQTLLSSNNINEVIKIRQERKETFNQIDDLEKIKFEIKTKTKLAVDNVELGMTPNEVIKVSGKYRAKDDCSDLLYYNYGKVWVMFRSNIVVSVFEAKYYKGACFASSGNYVERSIK
jgi:hypothetical protein